MVLYYAFGDGLGHLARASAVIYTFGYQSADFYILTSSDYASIIFEEENIISLPNELYSKPQELKAAIETIIVEYNITVLYIDSFPAGINGELNNLQNNNCQIRYIARLLNWTNYSAYLSNFKLVFDCTFIIEELQDEQFDFILKHSVKQQILDLKYPASNNFEKAKKILSIAQSPIWLIVHSGNADELDILYQYALDLALLEEIEPVYLIVSQVNERFDLAAGWWTNHYPASDFYEPADKIFTACGFNAMQQTIQYINKHHFVPFKRRFDDQFIRAVNRKRLIKSMK